MEKENKKLLGIVSDLHLRQNLPYHEYVEGGRDKEEKEILDFIVSSFFDVDKIVFVGDLLHNRTNSPEVIRKLVEFIERFEGKEVYIINGNHERLSNGKTSIDFLKEIKNPKWHIMTSIKKVGNLVFCPNISKAELEVKDNETGKKKIMKMLSEGKILFHHYAMTGTKTNTGALADMFDEIVLDRNKLKKKYDLVIGGHLHSPSIKENVIVTGSIFNSEVNEKGKCIWKVDEKTFEVEQVKLPGREIYGLENPTENDLKKIPKNSIVKVTLTDLKLKDKAEEIKEKIKKFDTGILLEQYPKKRKKIHFEEGMLEFDIEKLLEVYAKQKKVDVEKLKLAFKLIN